MSLQVVLITDNFTSLFLWQSDGLHKMCTASKVNHVTSSSRIEYFNFIFDYKVGLEAELISLSAYSSEDLFVLVGLIFLKN